MKSNKEQLSQRGYIEKEDVLKFRTKTKKELLVLLNSNEASIRTCAASLLEKHLDTEVACFLMNRLKIENKLYTKLAICETLSKGDENVIDLMIPYLGMIGDNQHKRLPQQPFKKKNYPLPRDIIARTLCRMGIKPLNALNTVLIKGEYDQKLEAIDAVGFISYYEKNSSLKPTIVEMFEIYKEDTLIIWKLLRALQSFSGQDVMDILKCYENSDTEQLVWEAKRSMKQILKQNINII